MIWRRPMIILRRMRKMVMMMGKLTTILMSMLTCVALPRNISSQVERMRQSYRQIVSSAYQSQLVSYVYLADIGISLCMHSFFHSFTYSRYGNLSNFICLALHRCVCPSCAEALPAVQGGKCPICRTKTLLFVDTPIGDVTSTTTTTVS